MQSAARITKPAPARRPKDRRLEPGQLLVLPNVSWEAYEQIGEALRDRPAIRLTYDQGTLEIMTTSFEHERQKSLLGMLIYVLCEEFALSVAAAGHTTFKKEDLDKGLEGDQSYYIANFHRIHGKKKIDLTVDPPPDLAVEIEVSRTVVSRLPIYARLRVPELWRNNGDTIRIYLLDSKGEYQEVDHSPTFPSIRIQEVARFLKMVETRDDITIARQFRAWVKKQLAKKKPKAKE